MELGYKIGTIRRINRYVIWWLVEGIGFLCLFFYMLFGLWQVHHTFISVTITTLYLGLVSSSIMVVICCIMSYKERGETRADVYENGLVLKEKKGKEIVYFSELTDWLYERDNYGRTCGVILKDESHRWLVFNQQNGGKWLKRLNRAFNQASVRNYSIDLLDKKEIQFAFYPALLDLPLTPTTKSVISTLNAPKEFIVVNSRGIVYGDQVVSFNEFKIAKVRKKQLYFDLYNWENAVVFSIPIATLSKSTVLLDLINQTAW